RGVPVLFPAAAGRPPIRGAPAGAVSGHLEGVSPVGRRRVGSGNSGALVRETAVAGKHLAPAVGGGSGGAGSGAAGPGGGCPRGVDARLLRCFPPCLGPRVGLLPPPQSQQAS